jgi:hypothetical protein
MGRFLRDLLLEQKLFDLLFPRIPVGVMKEITNKLREYDSRKKKEKENKTDDKNEDQKSNEQRKSDGNIFILDVIEIDRT